MATYSFNYNKSKDFLLLQSHLERHGIKNIEGISGNDTITTIHFFTSLTESEYEHLNGLLNNYEETLYTLDGPCENLITTVHAVNTNDWIFLCCWAFSGTHIKGFNKIIIRCCENNSHFALSLHDVDNNKTITSHEFSNSLEKYEIPIDISSLPYTSTHFELYIKGLVTIKNICIVWPN